MSVIGKLNKKKIINDPIYGFVTIRYDIIFDILSHPYFQRLRNIKQCAMTYMVYPGAMHTRFQHAVGAMYLMNLALDTLRNKGHQITEEEAEGAGIAILLHDIGHGPFSHALEQCIIKDLCHEDISLLIMKSLNKEFNDRLSLAMDIYIDRYPKKFLHQLVVGQLDLDRMDYLNRDSFFTGVSEGIISFDRIIKMLNVKNGRLAVEEKGIYSVEDFIIARRLMYWQVYFHKTVLSAELMLTQILKRAHELALNGRKIWSTPHFHTFLYGRVNKKEFSSDETYLKSFCKLDDHDIISCIKAWADDEDRVLSLLCQSILRRRLFKVEIQKQPITEERMTEMQHHVINAWKLTSEESRYFITTGLISNVAYDNKTDPIEILRKDGSTADIAQLSDNFNIEALTRKVEKFYLSFLHA